MGNAREYYYRGSGVMSAKNEIKEFENGACVVLDDFWGESILYASRELAQKAIDTNDLEFDVELMPVDS